MSNARFRKPRNSYSKAEGGPIAEIKAASRKWIYETILRSKMKIKEAALIVATSARDVKELDASIKPHSYVMINQDSAILGMICVPNTPKYRRFHGDTRYLFEPDSKSFQNFQSKYGRQPIVSDTNLVWLDFCCPVERFLGHPQSNWAEWRDQYLRRGNRWLFITHLIKETPLGQVIFDYERLFGRPVISHAYETGSRMCVIGIKS